MGRFVLKNLLSSVGLDHNQVVGMKANDLQSHLAENGLDREAILSIKRLRKRERIKRKSGREADILISNVIDLKVIKSNLESEKEFLQREIQFYLTHLHFEKYNM
ncbi:hypothetical protein LOD99_2317 [Oopsacas minuta]|uniref:Uncharacterized protein n=1 Tax=Oopsacas minuta TaxID=111878 RepID=A0AAV7K270_9METZ|nr:hypothetical protein LOD99_2317 [Oopsacas minuta]